MNLIAQVKLLTTPDQVSALKRTLETANAACGYISDLVWEHHCFKRYELQKRFYPKIRQKFPDLSSQVVIRCIAKVTDAYTHPGHQGKLDRKTKRVFKPHGSISYDQRILSWRTKQDEPVVSIWSVEGRLKILFALGPRQKARIEQRRAILQSVGTRSAKRALMKLSGRFARFQKHVNHCISKALVGAAKRTSCGIALEDLRGIRKRVRVRRGQRTRHHNWAFYQLGQFVTYKARLAGVAVTLVDPGYTSQLCPLCGHISRANRKSRDWFACSSCGFAAPADHVAAINIAARADVDRPMDSTEELKDIPLSIAAPFEVRVNAPQLAVE